MSTADEAQPSLQPEPVSGVLPGEHFLFCSLMAGAPTPILTGSVTPILERERSQNPTSADLRPLPCHTVMHPAQPLPTALPTQWAAGDCSDYVFLAVPVCDCGLDCEHSENEVCV